MTLVFTVKKIFLHYVVLPMEFLTKVYTKLCQGVVGVVVAGGPVGGCLGGGGHWSRGWDVAFYDIQPDNKIFLIKADHVPLREY